MLAPSLHPETRKHQAKKNRLSTVFLDGGGGGNRTRVRKSYAIGTTCLAGLLFLTGRHPDGRVFAKRAS